MKKVLFYILLILFLLILGILVWQKDAILLTLKNGVNSVGVVNTSTPPMVVDGGTQQVTGDTSFNNVGQVEDTVNSKYKGVKAYFLGVRGNAVLLDFKGRYVLIDGGFNDDKIKVISMLKQLGVKSLDYYIVSNYHDANIGVSYDLITTFSTNYIILPDNIFHTVNGRSLVEKLNKNKIIWSTGNHNVYYEVNKKYKLGFTLLRTYEKDSSIALKVENMLITGTTTGFSKGYLKDYNKVDILVLNAVNNSYILNKQLFEKVKPKQVILLGSSQKVDVVERELVKTAIEVIKIKGFCKKGVLDLGTSEYKCMK